MKTCILVPSNSCISSSGGGRGWDPMGSEACDRQCWEVFINIQDRRVLLNLGGAFEPGKAAFPSTSQILTQITEPASPHPSSRSVAFFPWPQLKTHFSELSECSWGPWLSSLAPHKSENMDGKRPILYIFLNILFICYMYIYMSALFVHLFFF